MDEENTINSNNYGFDFDVNNIDAALVGDYGLNAEANDLYGLATLGDTAVTVGSIFAGGAGIAKAGIAVGAKLTAKEAVKAFLKGIAAGAGKIPLTGTIKKTINNIDEQGLSSGINTISKLEGRAATKAVTKKASGTYEYNGTVYDLATKDGRKVAFKAMETTKKDVMIAMTKDAGLMAALGLGAAASIQGATAAASNATTSLGMTVFPPEIQMAGDLAMVDSYIESGNIEALLAIQKKMYQWDKVDSSSLTSLVTQGRGEDSADNMFWIQTRLAMGLENAKAFGDEYVPKDASEVILSVAELNKLYSDYDFGTGITSQPYMFSTTITDKIKKAQTQKFDFFFNGEPSKYLTDANGAKYRVTADEYYTLFEDYATENGITVDWLEDLSAEEKNNLSTNVAEFEKDSTFWSSSIPTERANLTDTQIETEKKVDVLRKYGVENINDIGYNADGSIYAKKDFGKYKANETIITAATNQADFDTFLTVQEEYEKDPTKKGTYDIIFNIDSEAGATAKAAIESEVGQNKIAAEAWVKKWYWKNGIKYNPNDTRVQAEIDKLANAGFSDDSKSAFNSSEVQANKNYFDIKYGSVMSEKIQAGEGTATDIVKPYIDRIAEAYGIDAESVNINDSLLKGIYKDDGSFIGMGEFEKQMRSKPSYQYTKEAALEAGQIASALANAARV